MHGPKDAYKVTRFARLVMAVGNGAAMFRFVRSLQHDIVEHKQEADREVVFADRQSAGFQTKLHLSLVQEGQKFVLRVDRNLGPVQCHDHSDLR